MIRGNNGARPQKTTGIFLPTEDRRIMRVIVTTDTGTTTYGYEPEHYARVNLFYAQELVYGHIVSYTIVRG